MLNKILIKTSQFLIVLFTIVITENLSACHKKDTIISALNRRIGELQLEINDLLPRIAALKARNKALEARNKALEAENRHLRDEIEASGKEASSLWLENTRLVRELKDLKGQQKITAMLAADAAKGCIVWDKE